MLTTVHHDITQEDMRPSLCESLLAESRRGEVELEEISTVENVNEENVTEEISTVENVTEENVNAGEGVKVSNTKRRRGLEGAEETPMEINPHIQKERQLAESALSPQPKTDVTCKCPSSPPQRNPQSFESSQSPTGSDAFLGASKETKAGD